MAKIIEHEDYYIIQQEKKRLSEDNNPGNMHFSLDVWIKLNKGIGEKVNFPKEPNWFDKLIKLIFII